MALDHPQSLSRMALLDIVPTHTLYANMSKALGLAYFHWLLLPQPAPLPETLLGNSIETFLRAGVFRGLVPDVIGEDVFAEYLRCAADAPTLHAMCEDYRAGASIDFEQDGADLDKKVQCPLLVLWGENGSVAGRYDALEIWGERAAQLSGKQMPGGHSFQESHPKETAAELRAFLAGSA